MTRIIAGRAKGRTLAAPKGSQTRPTTDRVREAAFSILADWAGSGGLAGAEQLQGLAFLDLFAGSGAVGLEASSRGASPVWAIEADRRVVDLIRRNAEAAGLGLQARATTVERFLAGPIPVRFDIVWADPPYETATIELEKMLNSLLTADWLADSAIIAVERSVRSGPLQWPASLLELHQRNYGETALYFATKGRQ